MRSIRNKILKLFIFFLFVFSLLPNAKAIDEDQIAALFSSTYGKYDEYGKLTAGSSTAYDFIVSSQVTKWNISAFWDTNESLFSVYLIDPDAEIVNSSNLPAGATYMEEAGIVLYSLENPKTGTWQIVVEALSALPEGSQFLLRFASDSPIYLESDFIGGEIYQNSTIVFDLKVFEGENPFTGAAVSAVIANSNNQTTDGIILGDDGAHNDGLSNDGHYAYEYSNTNILGAFTVRITAEGEDSQSHIFKQYYDTGYRIIESSLVSITEITGDNLKESHPPYSGIEVIANISNYDGTVEMTLLGELYDYQNNFITKGEGKVSGDTEDASATLFFPGEDIWKSKEDGPYTVKNLIILETETLKFVCDSDLEWQTEVYDADKFIFNDMDGDGLSDSDEQNTFNTNMNLRDTDLDGLSDYQEINYDGDDTVYTSGFDTDPLVQDTDGDSHIDGLDDFPLDPTEWLDRDSDGVGDNADYYPDDPNRWMSPEEEVLGVEFFDFNGDGDADVFLEDRNTREIYVWIGEQGDGLVSTLASSYDIRGIIDVDSDGNDDFIIKDHDTGIVYIWLMDGAQIKAQGDVGSLSNDYTLDIDRINEVNWDLPQLLLLMENKENGKVYLWKKSTPPEPPLPLILECAVAAFMNIYEDDNFLEENWETYAQEKSIVLSAGEGEKIINARFKDSWEEEIQGIGVPVIVDEVDPVITFTSLSEGQILNEPVINFYGMLSKSCFKVLVNQQEVPLGDSVFNADLTLNLGENIIKITAVDLNGNQGDLTLTVILE